ncbi:unnamed protein product [Cylicocyclus nassatus]|uniref:Replication protein A OB domain-containing protein n=1 Tax=Cylicocyclus nassatus TaxID=53992 RepID=A0AA36H8P1_CYLNA|nr:unnamed protein product [Cylicocyclus nassatus]
MPTSHFSIINNSGEGVDVSAVIDEINILSFKFVASQDRECVKRDLDLIDHSGVVMQLTLWNKAAEDFHEDVFGQTFIKKALVKKWND